ncbi:MAG: hypothetical protein H7241_09425 [Novosphingobium sp.]|nr:hypothetical protein [Novosphingobium sp.]
MAIAMVEAAVMERIFRMLCPCRGYLGRGYLGRGYLGRGYLVLGSRGAAYAGSFP